MKGVILAAGDGTRLAPLTLECPKALVCVDNKPMLAYTIESFVAAGTTELIIVVGYLGERIVERIGNGEKYGASIQYAWNFDFRRGNALSFYAAARFLAGEPFLLSMADHLICTDILIALRSLDFSYNAICIDRGITGSSRIAEATKVLVDKEGWIIKIGKNIRNWNALDAGVFLLTPEAITALNKLISQPKPSYQLCEVVTNLINSGPGIRACDISGAFWMDIDTPDDLEHVNSVLERRNGRFAL